MLGFNAIFLSKLLLAGKSLREVHQKEPFLIRFIIFLLKNVANILLRERNVFVRISRSNKTNSGRNYRCSVVKGFTKVHYNVFSVFWVRISSIFCLKIHCLHVLLLWDFRREFGSSSIQSNCEEPFPLVHDKKNISQPQINKRCLLNGLFLFV